MSFYCQKDSYCKEFRTRVRSCQPAQLKISFEGKKQKLTGYNVILEDTILFPEGGGQPSDKGWINDVEVIHVGRSGADAVHFVLGGLDPGSEVCVKVDWRRRWDHMQQHTAQHLITAIADRKYGYKTTSWNLGEKVSSIDLDTASMSDDQVSELEETVNELLQENVKVHVTSYDSKEDMDLSKIRTRGLPDDHVGSVRVITIEGIDSNMCCGTHVSCLGHIQAIKLLSVEKSKQKVSLLFVAGQRLLTMFGQIYKHERLLTAKLRANPEQQIDMIEKLQQSNKSLNKNNTNLLRELACLEAKLFLSQTSRPPYLSIHRREGDNEYMNMVVNEINDQDVIIFITTGQEKGQGLFLLSGPEHVINDIGPSVARILDGKGAAKRNRFQGKANSLQRRTEVEGLIEEYINKRS